MLEVFHFLPITILMTDASTDCIAGPAWQAARILQAWKCRDETAFRREVAVTLDLPLRGWPYVLEEQTEVLNTVATHMDRWPDFLNKGLNSPDGRACIALLSHLASQA